MAENREHCKNIAEELEKYYQGLYIKFDYNIYCIEDIEPTENKDGEDVYIVDNIEIPVDQSEVLSLYDYFNDCFDIEYRISSDKEYRSVRIMVACGGPNIYIDTASKNVEFYWWSESASYPISLDVIEEIDSIFEEYFNC